MVVRLGGGGGDVRRGGAGGGVLRPVVDWKVMLSRRS